MTVSVRLDPHVVLVARKGEFYLFHQITGSLLKLTGPGLAFVQSLEHAEPVSQFATRLGLDADIAAEAFAKVGDQLLLKGVVEHD